MQTNRALVIEENFFTRVSQQQLPTVQSDTSIGDTDLTPAQAVEIFESQVLSRCMDLSARELQKEGNAYYTIGSSGHEGNAAIAAALRPNDMAFLHYRDAAFLIQRSKQLPGQTTTWDMMLSFAASSDDPVSGGRHKVLGSKALFVPPQTSTIASHLPKAVGAAYSVPLNRRLCVEGSLPQDSVVLCSFGDASLNHSTAQGAINTSAWTSFQKTPLPLIWVCEDNGIGISVKTPGNWVRASMQDRPGIHYLPCDGLNIFDVYVTTKQAEKIARIHKKPVFLHMSCVRLMGHAGSDAQQSYLSRKEIEANEQHDPLLHTAGLLIKQGILTPDQIINLYQSIRTRVSAVGQQTAQRPRMDQAAEVMQSLIPNTRPSCKHHVDTEKRLDYFKRELSQLESPQHTAKLLNWTLTDLMLAYPNMVLAGEDVGKKGGVYGVTQKLQQKFGAHRVIDTLLDEQSILGLGIGMAHNRSLPVVEIQFLAYVHNAEDQIRGEAATLSFFSNQQFTNPMVIRIAGLAYQKGFGGHFHNDNSFNVFRDIPGLLVACPSNGDDAVMMLREAVRVADEEQRVVIFLEPIALYMTRDLFHENDGQWTFNYRQPTMPSADSTDKKSEGLRWGEVACYDHYLTHSAKQQLAIVTYGNGYYLSRQAAKDLSEQNLSLRVIDLRWLLPLPSESLLSALEGFDRVLVVDECRRTGSVSEELLTLLVENQWPTSAIARLNAEDSFIPLGKAATSTLPSRQSICDAALQLMNHED